MSQAQKIMDEARAKAQQLKDEAKKTGDALVAEADKQGKALEDQATNPFTKAAAKESHKQLVKEPRISRTNCNRKPPLKQTN